MNIVKFSQRHDRDSGPRSDRQTSRTMRSRASRLPLSRSMERSTRTSRAFLAMMTAVAQAIGICPAGAQAVDTGAPPCASTNSPGDIRAITCRFPRTDAPQRYRFKANFSGGHDDTKATITAVRGGRPLECEHGSKTSLFGEDGDVSLECIFSAGPVGEHTVVEFTVIWSHAQYRDFQVIVAP